MKNTRYLLWFLVSIASLPGQTPSTGAPPFTVTIRSVQPEVKVGEPAMIHIVLKDISQGQLPLPETRHVGSSGELNYLVTVVGVDGSPVPDTEYGLRFKTGRAVFTRSVLIKQLSFGEEVAEDADLNNVVKITSPGDYVVQVERSDRLYAGSHIKSNRLVIHVTP